MRSYLSFSYMPFHVIPVAPVEVCIIIFILLLSIYMCVVVVVVWVCVYMFRYAHRCTDVEVGGGVYVCISGCWCSQRPGEGVGFPGASHLSSPSTFFLETGSLTELGAGLLATPAG